MSSTQKLVLTAIAWLVYDNGERAISHKDLAALTGLERRTVMHAVEELAGLGKLKIQRMPGKQAVYSIPVTLTDMSSKVTCRSERHVIENDKGCHSKRQVHVTQSDRSETLSTITRQERHKDKERVQIDSRYSDFVEQYQKRVLEQCGNTAPKLTQSLIDNGANTLRLAVDRDGIAWEELQACLMWALEDSFWRDQVRSLANVRKKSSRNGCTKLQNMLSQYKKSIKNSNESSLDQYLEEYGGI